MRIVFFVAVPLVTLSILILGYHTPWVYWHFAWWLPLVAIGIYDVSQSKHAILRNFPLIGHFRYLFELIRPEINQYFIESDIDGRPFPRFIRTIIYARAKNQLDKEPFGTKLNLDENGSEWLLHSIAPKPEIAEDLRVTIGGPDCRQPYSSSILNISAMSYGSLSKNAVMAMNGGAKAGDFAHNTGEGGVSPYHLKYGGDLIWQIGTGYFGCRNEQGGFDEIKFKENAGKDEVKMIEVKLSQGAKPGHGGILPAIKNTPEIAAIRGVKAGTSVVSPPYHTAFSNPTELVQFIARLRDLSGGKPVGLKLCIGQKAEFFSICKAMVETGLKPDFITVDGAEGGTGAAPIEFSNWVGSPADEGLAFAYDALVGFDLKKDIKLIVAGKVATGFHIIKYLCLGADACNSARAMMMAAGCIQALRCHSNDCPTGVTTHKASLVQGLVVEDKVKRVAEYHRETIVGVKELVAALGVDSLTELNRALLCRRVSDDEVKRFDQIYPYCSGGTLIKAPFPVQWKEDLLLADSSRFTVRYKIHYMDKYE